MFFTESDIDQSILNEYDLRRKSSRIQILKDIADELVKYPEDYRLFGPYWWFLALRIKEEGICRRGWFHRSRIPGVFRDWIAGQSDEFMMAAALQYLRMMQMDPQPCLEQELEDHILEIGGECMSVQIIDSALSVQPDLFEDLKVEENRRRQFLRMPENYIPRVWKERGETLLAEGKIWESYRTFLRYLHVSESVSDQADGWFHLGMTFMAARHYAKAVFAFSNLYQRDSQDWVLSHLAEAHEYNGNLAAALGLMERAHAAVPGNPEYIQRLEQLREKTSRRETAPGNTDTGAEGTGASEDLPFYPSTGSFGKTG